MLEYVFWLFVSILVGGLSGFQGVYERFDTDSGRAAKTVWCWLYLVSRGAVAGGAFVLGAHLPYFDKPLFLRALVCGVSAEGVLRAKFFVKRVKVGDKNLQEITWNPVFDRLRWYQELFLKTIDRKFAKEKRALVAHHADNFASFAVMFAFFELQIKGWSKDPRAAALEKAATNLKRRFLEAGNTAPQSDKEARHELGYLVGDSLGLTDLKEFFQPKQQP